MPERTVPCARCGEVFTTTHPRKIYCTRKCASDAMNAKHNKRVVHELRPCATCGAEFEPPRSDSRFCSTTCRRRFHYQHEMVWHHKICNCCGNAFVSKRSDAARCSRQCNSAEWYERNRDAAITRATEWNRTNPARSTISNNHKGRRRAAETIGTGISHRSWLRIQRRQQGRCAYCRGAGPLTMDHIVPISRGGAHSEGNIAGACGPCNFSKSASLLVEWRKRMEYRASRL